MKVLFSRVLLASTLMLLACSEGFGSSTEQPAAPVLQAQPQSQPQVNDAPRQIAQTAASTSAVPLSATPVTEIYRGTGSVVGGKTDAPTSVSTVDEQGDITLNFVNADVRDVAKAILGDFLKLNYAVGANVQGTVTIQTSRPLARDKVLPILEQALRLNGMALVKADEIYKVVPLADAPRESGATRVDSHKGTLEPGYGVSIVPLKYVSANEMKRLIEPLGGVQGSIHADPVRNVLIIEGTEQERATMLDNIALFDVNWLSGMSFALYMPKYTDAQDLAKELDQIVGGRTGPLSGVVRFVPIVRLNAVLAISPQAKYLEQLQRWVQRLDRPGQGSDRRIFVYHVQNGRASDLARVLLKVLFGSNYDSGGKRVAPSGDAFAGPSEVAGGTAATSPPNAVGTLQSAPLESEPIDNGGAPVSREMANVNITADESNNALVIMATPQQYGVIENALRQLDMVPLQVLLEAAIAEVTLTDDLKYGVQYFYQPSDKHQFVLSNSASAAIAPKYPGFSYIFSEGTNIKVILNAISSVTHVEVVSSPQVMVLNNQTATLQVGNQVPIATAQQQSTVGNSPLINTIEYHDTGVILKVTPRVNQGGMVMMDISQEVSDVSTTTTSELDSPTIEVRKINSTVAVHDGETVALGGLIKDNRTKSRDGIPILQDIPLLGALFRTTEKNAERTELMVLITPHVAESVSRARAVTEELRQKLPAVQPLFGRAK